MKNEEKNLGGPSPTAVDTAGAIVPADSASHADPNAPITVLVEYCATCGNPRNRHPYRHPFVLKEWKRGHAKAEGR